MRLVPLTLLASALLLGHPGMAQNNSPSIAPTTPTANPAGADSKSAGAAAAPAAPTREIAVANLTNRDVKGKDGGDLGDIDRVVESTADKKPYVVVSRGGFLGFFEKQYLLPVEQLAVSSDVVTAIDTTQTQLEDAALFVDDPQAYRTIEEGQSVSVPAPAKQ